MNLDEYKSIETYWRALYVNGYNVTYFDSFRFENTPKQLKKFIGNKNIITYIYKIPVKDSTTCGYIFIGFIIIFMLKGKILLGYINLLSPNGYEKYDKTILKNFQQLKILFMNRF